MSGPIRKNAGVAQYELEIEIAASPGAVWDALVQQTNAWWLPDFHMTGEGSKVTFEARAGGALLETHDDGGSLLWGVVHWIRPEQRAVYIAQSIAPDWGGPAAGFLKLEVEERGEGAVLKVVDSHHGHIEDKTLASLEEGWTQLFSEGLKKFVEDGVRRDGRD